MNLEAVYPNDDDHNEELSFEELRAQSRGWLNRDWAAEARQRIAEASQTSKAEPAVSSEEAVAVLEPPRPKLESQNGSSTQLETTIALDIGREGRAARPKKPKLREVRGETQTSMDENVLSLGKEANCLQS